jgi:arsenate reductase (thioredoxin)
MSEKRVLFLCTGNSARSQMAEALLRHLAGDAVDVASAGIEPKGLHPLAVKAMSDIGIDISRQRSKGLDAVLGQTWDFVITVCDSASESCPIFPGDTERVHWSFEDPAAAEGSEEERLRGFRRVRDELLGRLRLFVLAQHIGQGAQAVPRRA